MVFLTVIKATPNIIRMQKDNYVHVTDIFGLPRQKTKDLIRIRVSIFGIKVDTSSLIILNKRNKLQKLSEMVITEFDF